ILVSTDRYATVAYGDQIQFSGTVKEPEAFETEFGRTFDYPGYLAVRDIFYTVSFVTIEVTASGQGNPLLSVLFAMKQRFLEHLKLVIPEPAVGLGAGLLLGVKASLGEEIEAAFRETGIIHIVVLSGANIMLIVIFLMYTLALVVGVRTRAVIGMMSIVLFALMVGFSATVVRASIMAVLIMLALLLGRRYAIMRALFCAGVIMLMINPLLLVYDIGFQLSFLATLGLVIVAPQFEVFMHGVPSAFKLKEYFLATISTQLAILPLLLYQIGQFSVVAVLVNMAVLPMVPVAMLLTFITGVMSFIFPVVATVSGVVATVTLSYIIVIATYVASLPFASFVVPQFPFILVIVAYGLLGYSLYWYRSKTSVPPEVDTSAVADWIIMDEQELKLAIQKREPSPRPVSAVETLPIFFR
ncbi:MAG: ComEC/Rec2 family competence protein, partial [Patescibacteria group bacterium]